MTTLPSPAPPRSLPQGTYDVVIIGAGINGVGIAQDAALRGLRVLLLEQEDICSGVSAWSGRLVHGGLRYLEHYDVRLVRESLRERERLFRLAPHLVKPVPLMMPFYRRNTRPSWLVRLGMITYDVLSWDKSPPRHRILGSGQARERFLGMTHQGLSGAALFYDGQVELAERLCVEIAVDAVDNGAVVALHTRVDDVVIEHGRVTGVCFTDVLSGEKGEVSAPVILNVAGPWIDQVLTNAPARQPRLNGGTKGSHLIVDAFPGAPKDVVYYESQRDGRLVLVIPWMGRYLIGTTDIRLEGDPSSARCDIGEADYLLDEVNALVPEAGLTLDDVLYTYSGVRPLPYAPDKAESSVSRSHVLFDHAEHGLPGLVTVVGGKLTTYRQLAQDAVDDVYRRLGRKAPKCSTKERTLPGARPAAAGADLVSPASATSLSKRTEDRLTAYYGSRAGLVRALAQKAPELAAVVHEPSGLIAAELVFAVDHDLAVTLADVLARRVLLAFEPGHGLDSLDRAVTVLGDHLGWDDSRRASEVAGYRSWLDRLAVPDPSGPRSLSFGAGASTSAR